MQDHFPSQPYQPIRKPISEQLLRLGAFLLVMSALSLVVSLIGSHLSQAVGSQSLLLLPFALLTMLVLVYGIPAIFIGVLFLLSGFTIRRLGARGSLVNRIVGLFSIGMGALAWVPQMFVSSTSGENWTWIAVLTALLVGLALPSVGLVFLVRGIIGAAEETSRLDQELSPPGAFAREGKERQ